MAATDNQASYDYLFKIMILGRSWAGRWDMLDCYEISPGEENYIFPGLELKQAHIEVDGVILKLEICDTALIKKWSCFKRSLHRDAVGALLIFDLTS